jgi:hypothetical protein
MRRLYLVLAFLGTAVPYSALLSFLREEGPSPSAFVAQLFATDVSAFFGWDVILSSFAVIAFVLVEGRRLGMEKLWVYVAANLIVGVSLALPLFLYVREGVLTRRG